METALKLIAGAGGGALLGYLISRIRLCGARQCSVRANVIYSILAGAVFGAAVAWYWLHR